MILDAQNKPTTAIVHQVLDTELGIITIYDNIIIMEAKENVLVSFKTGIFILLKVIALVGTRPMVYISNRVNSYAVDPTDYKYLEMLPTLKGIAVVTYSGVLGGTAKLEQRFFNKPFESFNSVTEAAAWASTLLNTEVTL